MAEGFKNRSRIPSGKAGAESRRKRQIFGRPKISRIKEESGKGSVIFYPIQYTLQSRAPAAQPACRDSRLYSILVICAVFIAAKSQQMSKKFHMQENPADQVVICDALSGYSENLASALADLAGGQAQVHLFHQIERAVEFCAKNPADILLVAEEFPAEERRKIFAAGVFLLTGENPKCSAQNRRNRPAEPGQTHPETGEAGALTGRGGETKAETAGRSAGAAAGEIEERRLFRYQPADAIWKAITEYEKTADGAVSFAAEERPPGRYWGEDSRQGLKESGNRQREPPQSASVLQGRPAASARPDSTGKPAFSAGPAGDKEISSVESTYAASPAKKVLNEKAPDRGRPPEEPLHEEALYRARPSEEALREEALYRARPPEEALPEEALYRARPSEEALPEETLDRARAPEKTLQGETLYRSRAPAQAPARTVRGLVAVYSPVHRIGKTRFALRLARQFAEKTPVLYLNLEGCSGQGGGLFPENGPDLGDLLYYSRQENINFGLKLSTLTEQKDGVDYIRPMKNIQDFYAVKEREWLRLFRRITGKSIYEILILDLGDGTDGLFDILKACSRIYTPYTDEPVARAKLAQYEKTLKEIGYGEILARTVKKRMSKDEPD